MDKMYLKLTLIIVQLLLSEFIQMALNFEDCRRRWLRLERDLGSCKEVLSKAETERGALEVKLKHARNQVDVEIRRRQKAEADCDKLVCMHRQSLSSYFLHWHPQTGSLFSQ